MKEIPDEDNTETIFHEVAMPENTYKHVNDDLLWLLDVWFSQLVYLLKQTPKTWYFSREFFISLIRYQHTIGWKLVQEGFKAIEVFKKPWSQLQLFLLLGEACNHVETPAIEMFLKNVAKLIVKPMKNMLSESMNPAKKTLCAKKCSLLVRKLKYFGIQDSQENEIAETLTEAATAWRNEKKRQKHKKKKDKEKEHSIQ